MPPYGGSIAQQVYYANSDLCDEADPTKGYPQREKDSKGKQKPWEAPFILMVDRGGCTFVKKVRIGFVYVIIGSSCCVWLVMVVLLLCVDVSNDCLSCLSTGIK